MGFLVIDAPDGYITVFLSKMFNYTQHEHTVFYSTHIPIEATCPDIKIWKKKVTSGKGRLYV